MTTIAVRNLSVAYERSHSQVTVLSRVSLEVDPGEVLGLVGESGSGKSTLGLHMLGWKPAGSRCLGGSVELDGVSLLALSVRARSRLWGARLAYVPQEVSVALNPARRVAHQLEEPLRMHLRLSADERRDRIRALLDSVRIPSDRRTLAKYPFEFSGGQQQRLALALAMSCSPSVLVLDEPTTGIDATSKLGVLAAVRSLLAESRTAVVYISHDLAETASICDRIAVMYAGEVVEQGPARAVYNEPRHPYAIGLRAAVPGIHDASFVRGIPGMPPGRAVEAGCSFAPRCAIAVEECRSWASELTVVEPEHEVRCFRAAEAEGAPIGARDKAIEWLSGGRPILGVSDLTCSYGHGDTRVLALDGVSLELGEGTVVGIVGESGSGKSTLLHTIAGLHRLGSGELRYRDVRLADRVRLRTTKQRREIQLVFQNPGRALNPRQTVEQIVSAPIRLYQPELRFNERRQQVADALEAVRLGLKFAERIPRELSGGEKQRVALARAFAAKPRVLLCDEVVSALDVSVQATIMELISGYVRDHSVSVFFVTHDLAVARMISDRIAVFREGKICEEGDTEELFDHPRHPYTAELIGSLPE